MLGCPDFREGRQYGFMIVFGIWGESNKILLKIYRVQIIFVGFYGLIKKRHTLF